MDLCRRRSQLIATIVFEAMISTLPGCATCPAFDPHPQAQPPLHSFRARFVFNIAKSSFLAIGHSPSTFYGVPPEHLAIAEMRGLTEIKANSAAVALSMLQKMSPVEQS